MKKSIFMVIFLAIYVFSFAKVSVVVSIVPLYNITKSITGDMVDIEIMVPPGASPHTFSPKPGQLRALAKADVFIMVGSGFEFWAGKMIKASGNKKMRVVAVTDGIKLVAEADDHHAHGETHAEEGGNPHIWLDPVLAIKIAQRIEREISLADPANKPRYLKNLRVFTKKASLLDREFAAEAKKFTIKEVVSFHPAWVYFEKRYGLREAGVIQASPGREPSPKQIRDIITQVKKYGIKAIFAEPQLPRKAADVIAKEAGVKVLIIDPNGIPDGDYPGFMRKNFEIMKEAMK